MPIAAYTEKDGWPTTPYLATFIHFYKQIFPILFLCFSLILFLFLLYKYVVKL